MIPSMVTIGKLQSRPVMDLGLNLAVLVIIHGYTWTDWRILGALSVPVSEVAIGGFRDIERDRNHTSIHRKVVPETVFHEKFN